MGPPGLLGPACLWASSVYKRINHLCLNHSSFKSLGEAVKCNFYPMLLGFMVLFSLDSSTTTWATLPPSPLHGGVLVSSPISLHPLCAFTLYGLCILSKPWFCKLAMPSRSLYFTPIPPSTLSSTVTSSQKSSLIPQTRVRLWHKHLSLSNSRLSLHSL